MHVVLHPEEGQVFSEIVDQVEGPLFLQLFTEILLSLTRSGLIGTQSFCDFEAVIEIRGLVAVLGSKVFFDFDGLFLEIAKKFLEGRSIVFIVGEHHECDFFPGGVEFFGVLDLLVGTLELLDFLK